VEGNDNTRPAGALEGTTLVVHLEIGEADWRWEQQLPPYRILAFAEASGPLTTPGPLIRVREGTRVRVVIRSRVATDVIVHGLHGRPGDDVSLRVPAHGTAETQFRAGSPGTYYYWGSTSESFAKREHSDSQLTGAFIIDPERGGPPDRIFVIGYHAQTSPVRLDAWVINGRSWPETERLTYRVGEPVHWRWINATDHRHPMHLHGTYFRVHSTGDNHHDTVASDPPEVVTQVLQPGTTMALTWSPARPGNWLFHCHNLFHVTPDNRLQLPQWYDEYAKLEHDQHMAGLVLGIHAQPGPTPAVTVERATPMRIALTIGERSGVRYRVPGLDRPGLGYGVDGGPITAPGPTLVLERGRPAEVAITSRIAHATQVHWHGIELDSYYDGVPHWGGDSRQMTPLIDPDGSFVARFVPPRAGTFIYHTHFNDYVQLATGLYGALIIVEPGERLDPETDHLFIISRDGLDEDRGAVLVNGATSLAPLTLRAGKKHRLRFIGITPVSSSSIRLLAGGHPVKWRALAKDGADLPAALATQRPAELTISPGETYDFELDAEAPAELELQIADDRRSAIPTVTTRLSVRP
jgi:FtsP/CotA-like multicopper oxidase with cupredoxin domain